MILWGIDTAWYAAMMKTCHSVVTCLLAPLSIWVSLLHTLFLLQPSLHPTKLGDSAGLLVGQKVFAIGNPFGLDHTLTMGIISGTGREISSGNTGRPIQASINSAHISITLTLLHYFITSTNDLLEQPAYAAVYSSLSCPFYMTTVCNAMLT